MLDFSSLQIKINDLKAKVEHNSISPAYLGALLDDFISQMTALDMTDMATDVKTAVNNSVSALSNAQSALSTSERAEETAAAAAQNALTALTKVSEVFNLADAAKSVTDSVGKPGGIAPLDSSGLIPTRYIPGAMDDVVEFAGIIDTAPDDVADSSGVDGAVVFCSATNRFLLRSNSLNPTYYANWDGAESFGEMTASGRAPVGGKIYVDTQTNRQYRWGGTTMSIVGTDLALGYTPQTAFPGNEGAELREDVDQLETSVEELRRTGAATPRFSGIVIEGASPSIMASTELSSEDLMCDVVYLQAAGIFALRTRGIGSIEGGDGGLKELPDSGDIEGGLIEGPDTPVVPSVSYRYFAEWADAESMGMCKGENGYEPKPEVLYQCTRSPYGFMRFHETTADDDGSTVITPERVANPILSFDEVKDGNGQTLASALGKKQGTLKGSEDIEVKENQLELAETIREKLDVFDVKDGRMSVAYVTPGRTNPSSAKSKSILLLGAEPSEGNDYMINPRESDADSMWNVTYHADLVSGINVAYIQIPDGQSSTSSSHMIINNPDDIAINSGGQLWMQGSQVVVASDGSVDVTGGDIRFTNNNPDNIGEPRGIRITGYVIYLYDKTIVDASVPFRHGDAHSPIFESTEGRIRMFVDENGRAAYRFEPGEFELKLPDGAILSYKESEGLRARRSATSSFRLNDDGLLVFTSLFAKPDNCPDIADYTPEEKALLNDHSVQRNILDIRREAVHAEPTDGVLEAIEPGIVATALRKTAQVLTASERSQVLANLGNPERLLFDRLWIMAGGSIIVPGTTYGLNGLDDITYDQALSIMIAGKRQSSTCYAGYIQSPIRTNLPRIGQSQACDGSSMFYRCQNLEVASCQNIRVQSGTFSDCSKLRRIHEWVYDLNGATSGQSKPFKGCVSLEYIDGYIRSNNDIYVEDCPRLTLGCLQVWIQKALNTAPINIFVHADVMAKLTGDTTNEAAGALSEEEAEQWMALVEAAAEKNITFITV